MIFAFRSETKFRSTEKDNEQIIHSYSPFSRVSDVKMSERIGEAELQNLKVIFETWNTIDSLWISQDNIEIFNDLNLKRSTALWVDYWSFINKKSDSKIPNKAIDFLNLIHPNSLSLRYWDWSFDAMEILFDLKSGALWLSSNAYKPLFFELKFTCPSILFMYPETNQKLYIKWETLMVDIDAKGFKKLILLKANKTNL